VGLSAALHVCKTSFRNKDILAQRCHTLRSEADISVNPGVTATTRVPHATESLGTSSMQSGKDSKYGGRNRHPTVIRWRARDGVTATTRVPHATGTL
jgi:hypothetical protein